MRTFFSSLLCIMLFSCSASKSVATATKPSKKTLKGTWEVTNIRFIGEEGIYKAQLFDIADSPCFKGSQWVFIPNNGTGKFTVNNSSNCSETTQRILWSFFESGEDTQLQFKLVDSKNKPLSATKSGYRMKIVDLSAATMETRIQTSQDGNPFEVVLSFQKSSEEINL